MIVGFSRRAHRERREGKYERNEKGRARRRRGPSFPSVISVARALLFAIRNHITSPRARLRLSLLFPLRPGWPLKCRPGSS